MHYVFIIVVFVFGGGSDGCGDIDGEEGGLPATHDFSEWGKPKFWNKVPTIYSPIFGERIQMRRGLIFLTSIQCFFETSEGEEHRNLEILSISKHKLSAFLQRG